MFLFYAYVFLYILILISFFFFFQAEDGIRDGRVTGVQTCALPILNLDDVETGGERAFRGAAERVDDGRDLVDTHRARRRIGRRERRVGRSDRLPPRSEERRVGKECRSRWSPDHEKEKQTM